jgi:hypothetical protein
MKRVVDMHNELVERVMALAASESVRPKTTSGGHRGHPPSVFEIFNISGKHEQTCPDEHQMKLYVELLLGFVNGMAMWMAVSKRYVA